ncbi:hypothetical protein [aff. Roholtiella sp. LEGE 12411]|uniref:hypothetical protein n=1 Tax=aff. Roholtiella sp. LEGE 12411 TaxID=1828822 RepID=UPI001882F22B|nr:hypothetical protein [aff. Roholtiella sp. LEGE 12411]MBE9034863.1 hypothetical protein [aff. Roholtiella sp. LEGE 12411]
MNFHEKSVLAVTILLRKVARCILGTRNWFLTLLRRQRKKTSFRPAVGGWSFCLNVLIKFGLEAESCPNYTEPEAIANTPDLLTYAAERLMRLIKVGQNLAQPATFSTYTQCSIVAYQKLSQTF